MSFPFSPKNWQAVNEVRHGQGEMDLDLRG